MHTPGTPSLRPSPAFTTAVVLPLAFLLASAAPARAQEALSFFKNYFVTGDYAAAGVALRGSGVNGFATGGIEIAGVPPDADVLGAFLYWQTVVTQQKPDAGVIGASFRGQPLTPDA